MSCAPGDHQNIPARNATVKPLLAVAGADADEKPPPVAKTVVRTYDLRWLLTSVPNFTDALDLSLDDVAGKVEPPSGGSGAGLARTVETGKTYEQMIEELTGLIQATIAVDTWKDGGGVVGWIKEYDQFLIINHTPEVHEEIRKLLDDFKGRKAKRVRIRAHWVLAERADLEAGLKPADAHLQFGGKPATRPYKGEAALQAISAADLDRLPGALAHFKGEIVCQNGQRVSVWAAQAISGVMRVNTLTQVDVVGPRIEPEVSSLTRGLVLDLRQQLNPEGTEALVTLRSQWKNARTEPAAPSAVRLAATQPAGGAKQLAEAVVPTDRREATMHDLRTSVNVPLGEMVLVGGITLDAAMPAGNASKTPPQLYLFIEVTAD